MIKIINYATVFSFLEKIFKTLLFFYLFSVLDFFLKNIFKDIDFKVLTKHIMKPIFLFYLKMKTKKMIKINAPKRYIVYILENIFKLKPNFENVQTLFPRFSLLNYENGNDKKAVAKLQINIKTSTFFHS